MIKIQQMKRGTQCCCNDLGQYYTCADVKSHTIVQSRDFESLFGCGNKIEDKNAWTKSYEY